MRVWCVTSGGQAVCVAKEVDCVTSGGEAVFVASAGEAVCVWSQVPLHFHTDSAATLRTTKHRIYSWSSALKLGCSLDSKWLITLLEDHLWCDEMEEDLVKVIAWSVQALQAGEWPRFDPWGGAWPPESKRGRHAGSDLCPGRAYTGFFAGWKGDLEAKLHTHRFRCRNYLSTAICEMCDATRPIRRIVHAFDSIRFP